MKQLPLDYLIKRIGQPEIPTAACAIGISTKGLMDILNGNNTDLESYEIQKLNEFMLKREPINV